MVLHTVDIHSFADTLSDTPASTFSLLLLFNYWIFFVLLFLVHVTQWATVCREGVGRSRGLAPQSTQLILEFSVPCPLGRYELLEESRVGLDVITIEEGMYEPNILDTLAKNHTLVRFDNGTVSGGSVGDDISDTNWGRALVLLEQAAPQIVWGGRTRSARTIPVCPSTFKQALRNESSQLCDLLIDVIPPSPLYGVMAFPPPAPLFVGKQRLFVLGVGIGRGRRCES